MKRVSWACSMLALAAFLTGFSPAAQADEPDKYLYIGDIPDILWDPIASGGVANVDAYLTQLENMIHGNGRSGTQVDAQDLARRREAHKDGGDDVKARYLRDLLALDPSDDDVLTIPEIDAQGRRAFNTLDANNDGKIDAAELRKARTARQEPMTGPVFGCKVPALPEDEAFVFIGGIAAQQLATTSVIGQDGLTTTTLLDIAAGARPIYLVLASSAAMIWQFQGDVKRIRHVVVLGPVAHNGTKTSAGVMGVRADKVTIRHSLDCLPTGYIDTQFEGFKTYFHDALVERFGRDADVLSLARVIAPRRVSDSGVTVLPYDEAKHFVPPGTDERTWRDMQILVATKNDFYVNVDVDDVVSSRPAEKYTLLPGWGGLSQLVHDGFLARVDDDAPPDAAVEEKRPKISFDNTNTVILQQPDGSYKELTMEEFKKTGRSLDGQPPKGPKVAGGKTFRMLKPVPALPFGLFKPVNIRLIVPKDMPLPEGSIGDSCLQLEGYIDESILRERKLRRCK